MRDNNNSGYSHFDNYFNQNGSNNLSHLYSVESEKKEESFENNKELNLIFCPECSNIYKIKFKNINAIKASCNCKCLENFAPKEYLKQVKNDEKNNELNINKIFCKIHKKSFQYHCYVCVKDLCEDCLILNFAHKGHTIILFSDNNISKKGNEEEILKNIHKKIQENNEKYKKDNNLIYFLTDKHFLQNLEKYKKKN